MKNSAIILNCARGGVIDESALITALDASEIGVAALDVFDNEPTPRVDILENKFIACTPHIGAATVEAQDRIGEELADQINDLLK